MATKKQIKNFCEFASRQVDNGGANLSMDALYGLWRSKNPTADELASSVAAVEAAIADLQAGDTGESARDALRKTCHRLGLVIDR